MLDFATDQFEWSHGKKPRGHGLWMFQLSLMRVDGRRACRVETFEFNGSYGDAKRAAVKHARSMKAEWMLVEGLP
jgi:hypothetical protein